VTAPVAGETRRDAGFDALRAAVTLLVVLHHSAITYGALGGWYYREILPGPLADASLQTRLLIIFVTVNQAWFMGLFFLLAGYFTPGAVDRAGAWRYLKGRVCRLGVPLLVYGLLLGPVTIAMAGTARGHPFLTTLLNWWGRGRFEPGPLWFLLALLIFAIAYLLWRPAAARLFPRPLAFPSNTALAAGAILTGMAAFILRLAWPVGTQVWGLQPGYFASYTVLFAAGCQGARAGWLHAIPDRQRRARAVVAWLALPVLFLAYIVSPAVPALRATVLGDQDGLATIYAFWEPLVAWGFILSLINLFQRRFTSLGPIWSALSRRAYTIYIIHPPVLVAIALAWRGVAAPPLVKFAVTGAAACLASFWIAGLALRVPWIRRVV
jgi:fucose 4-O-acetylase-like acetyltransferase